MYNAFRPTNQSYFYLVENQMFNRHWVTLYPDLKSRHPTEEKLVVAPISLGLCMQSNIAKNSFNQILIRIDLVLTLNGNRFPGHVCWKKVIFPRSLWDRMKRHNYRKISIFFGVVPFPRKINLVDFQHLLVNLTNLNRV